MIDKELIEKAESGNVDAIISLGYVLQDRINDRFWHQKHWQEQAKAGSGAKLL